VDDVVSGMVAAATAPNVDRLVINVGSGVGTSVRELIPLISEVTCKQVNIVENPRGNSGVSLMCADLTLAQKILGYSPRVSLIDGLRLTLERDPRFKPSQ
jgi:nucleoside-diphosphate-sugar epimerase